MKNKYVILLATVLIVASLIFGAVFFPSEAKVDEEKLNEFINLQITEAVTQATLVYQTEIDRLNGLLLEVTPIEPEESEVEKSLAGYNFEDVFLTELLDKLLSDRDFSNLYDSEVEFDGEDYDVEELFLVNGKLAINGDDFEENAYLTFEEGSLVYTIDLDTTLNLSEVTDDETLIINFLGNDIEISEWVGEDVTFTQGEEYLFAEEESQTIDGKLILLELVLDDKVYVNVDGASEKLEGEGDITKINGIEIELVDIMYTERQDKTSKATLRIGDEVKNEVSDGDEYSEDSIWDWQISESSIGLILSQEFTELDDRDDFNALDVDGKLCLPNNYLCVEYSGLVEEDVEEYTFEIEDTNLIVVEGNFLAGLNDYDELFLNFTNGFFYEDDDCNDEITEDVFFGDSEVELTFNITTGLIYFDDIELSLDLNDMTVNSVNVSSEEDSWRSSYGTIIKNPEDSVKDNEISVVIPEERLEGLVKVY